MCHRLIASQACPISVSFVSTFSQESMRLREKKIFEEEKEEIIKLFRPVAKAIKLFFTVVIVPPVVADIHFQPSLMFQGEARSLLSRQYTS